MLLNMLVFLNMLCSEAFVPCLLFSVISVTSVTSVLSLSSRFSLLQDSVLPVLRKSFLCFRKVFSFL